MLQYLLDILYNSISSNLTNLNDFNFLGAENDKKDASSRLKRSHSLPTKLKPKIHGSSKRYKRNGKLISKWSMDKYLYWTFMLIKNHKILIKSVI